MPEQYRWDGSTGTLYEYSKEHRAYLFAAKANGRTEKQTIADYEEALIIEIKNILKTIQPKKDPGY